MSHQRILSSRFNMSLGFAPAILTMLLLEFIAEETAIYIGAGVGLLSCLLPARNRRTYIPHPILHYTTGVLLLWSVVTLLPFYQSPTPLLPYLLEVCILVPTSVLFFYLKQYPDFFPSMAPKCDRQRFAQRAEATIVSARVVILIGLLHLLVTLATTLLAHPSLSEPTRYLLFQVAPPLVFTAGILFNQFGIFYFNTMMDHTDFIPIVNTRGDVIGKAIASEAIGRKHVYILPVVRIAVTCHGMLYLRPRCDAFEGGRTDLPMEGYLIYGETLEQGAHRILRQALPNVPEDSLHFSLMHHFENEETNRLVYLFTLDLDDDSYLQGQDIGGGKLWTFQQIWHNLERDYFGSCLEYEVEHLEDVICTREKYKES